jgi:hypothetical protein
MLRPRCLMVPVLTVLALFAWQALARGAAPSVRPPDQRPIRIDFDPELSARLEEATQLIQRESWADALRILQTILDSPSDSLFICAPAKPEDPPTSWRSGWTEATRLLATFPPKELAEFQRQAEPAAREVLRRALEKDDCQLYARVYFRYPHTNASGEAAALLANHDRRDYVSAAILFRKVLSRPEWADKLSPLSLYHATLAFCFSGDAEGAGQAWKRLAAKLGEKPVRVEGRLLRLDELKKEVDKAQAVRTSGPPEWLLYRGTPARRPAGLGGPFALTAAWSSSTIRAPESGAGDAATWSENLIKAGRQQLDAKQAPVLPGFHPLLVKGQAIYRTHNGLYAAYLREHTIEFTVGNERGVEKKNPGDYAWWTHIDGGVLSLVRDPNKKGVIDSWSGQYMKSGGAAALFENSLVGTMSSDGERVFLVDDLALPPHPQSVTRFRQGWGPPNFGALQQQAVGRNCLKAISIELGGGLRWDLGGEHDPHPTTKDSFFLGPPLPIDKNLYVLNEKDGALRLIRLEVRDGLERNPTPPDLVWTVKLADVRTRMAFDFPRRIHAAHIAYANGIFVCPTNAGAIFGVDPLALRVAWAYRYATVTEPDAEDDKPIDPLTEHWKVTAPAVVGDLVLFTAPDGVALECLELASGQPRWREPRRAGDLYFAGAFDGLALVVNRDHCRALKLADGSLAWKLDKTGVPSGQGVAAAGVYYLPLSAGAESKEPAVLAIDIAKGTVVRRLTKKVGKADVPGNLIFANGQVISQTVDSVSSYPLLKE